MIEGLAYPPTVFIDTLNVCNARCPFCPLFQGDSQFDRELRPAHIMTMDLYEKLLNEVVSWQPLPASLIHSGTGDILYDPKVVQRLQLLKKYDLAKITTLMTNAQHLGEAVASEIVEAGVAQVIIGFDGASKEVYEAHRVRCQYARVLENIKKFVEIRDRNCGSTSIWIKYVRTPQNQHEVEQAFELFSKIMNHSIDRFQDALSVDWADDDQSESGVYLRPKVYGGELRSEGCSYLEDVIQVNSDGIVSACCWDYNLTISDGGLGRAPDTSLHDIWHGEKRTALRKAHKSGQLPSKCQTCIIVHKSSPMTPEMMKIDGNFLETVSDTTFIYKYPERSDQAKL